MSSPPLEIREASGPRVDLAIDGVFHLPPSERSRHPEIAIWTVLVALLLHGLIAAVIFFDWKAKPSPEVKPIEVALVREPPKPPEQKPPQPKEEAKKPPEPPKPPEPQPQPQPQIQPRESGSEDKTEAAKHDKAESNLPASVPKPTPEAAEVKPPEPTPPAPKPVPQRTPKESALGKSEIKPLPPLPQALLQERPAAPPFKALTLRLPSPGGGTGERDMAGDAYLNKLLQVLESHRVYPPGEAFDGAATRTAVFAIAMEPSGEVVNIKLVGTTGVPKLDEMAREMITDSSPFPRLPPDYPQIRTPITIYIPVFPRK
jgi:protein TonB